MSNTARLLNQLESLQADASREKSLSQALGRLDKHKISQSDLLIQLHERLLFLLAYPPSQKVARQVRQILKTFKSRVDELAKAGADVSAFADPEVSGIAGTAVTSNFSYALVRWLVANYPAQVSIDWEWFDEEERFGATMPRFLPLLEEDAMVEAHVPYRDWLRAARGKQNEVTWIIKRFESLNLTDKQKAELYDALKLHITWQFGLRSSRTAMTLPARRTFFHDRPLIQRRDISLLTELNSAPIPVQKVTPAAGQRILDLARETSAVRYRELHGFTHGDSRYVLKAELGRGVEVFVMGVPPEQRLPLRAYHAAIIFKNGVPVAYFEGLSLFERMESGFNLYYTFRDGETAWLYARILRLMRQLLGVTVFSIEPYQIGHENEEGIESGAYWFYRKLGFRPVKKELMKLTLSEEHRLSQDRSYRSSARTLRKLAAGHMLFELSSRSGGSDWDHFEVRKIGIAVQRRMAREFRSNPQEMRAAAVDFVTRALRLRTKRWIKSELDALSQMAPPLAMLPDIEQWNRQQSTLAADVIRAKADRNEARYLKLMQKHDALRAGLIRLGT